MKKTNRILLLLLTLMLAAVPALGLAEAAPVYDLSGVSNMELVLSSALSLNHGCWEGFYVPWMKAVTDKSEGKVTFLVFPAGEIVEGGKEFDGLREGVIDIAAPMMPVYDSSRFPLSDVAMLPLGETNAAIGTKAFDLLLSSEEKVFDGKTYYEEEFQKNGLFFVGHNIPPGSAINTTGKELTDLNAIKSLRIRTGSITTQMFAEIVGMTPISMPAFELFDAMSRGAVDGSFIHVADWTGYGFQDLFKYSIKGLNFGHFTAGLAMMQDKYDALPPVVQQIFLDAAEEVKPGGAQLWDNRTVEIMESTQAKGVKFVDASELPQEVQDALNKGIVDTWAKYIETKGESGKALAKLWLDCVIQAGGTAPEGVRELFD